MKICEINKLNRQYQVCIYDEKMTIKKIQTFSSLQEALNFVAKEEMKR